VVSALVFRDADLAEADALAQLWHDGWQDTHAAILPMELARYRTLESFRQRMRDRIADVRAVGAPANPLGFSMLKDDELYQFYVAVAARGTGIAAALLADAESVLRSRGVRQAWLACAIGNDRAAKFYEKNGWRLIGELTYEIPLPGGEVFDLDVWRYEKNLG
jgi:GNAT superfamily N-acetyltransferase